MAALQSSPVSLQSKISPSTRLSATFSSRKPLNLSFPSIFPSVNLAATSSSTRSRRGGFVVRVSGVSPAEIYASALADVAKSNDTLEATFANIEKIGKLFSEPAVYDFFDNPCIELEKKQELIDEIIKNSSLLPHTANFLNLLLDSQRIDMIKEIIEEFEKAYNVLTDTEVAIVASVVKLEQQHLSQIAKQVQKLTGAKNVRMKTVLDPSLVAGFTVRFGDGGSKLIDMSVKKQLEEIAAELELEDIQLAV